MFRAALPAIGTGVAHHGIDIEDQCDTAIAQGAGVGIAPQAVTLNGGSVLTLVGANSLTSVTFNNNGGAAPTLTPTGTLTLTGSITSNPSNVSSQATIGTGNLDLPKFMGALKKINFTGPLVIEYEGDIENPVPALKECVAALKKTM